MNDITILLPNVIPLLRTRPNQSIHMDSESFCLYFENLIHPLRPEYDVVVDCAWGGNFGSFWRISEFPDADSFPLTVRVYDEWGRLLAEKSTRIELYEKGFSRPPFRLLCFGDSLTHRHTYVDHLVTKLANVSTVGIRSHNGGTVRHEGRGGWTLTDYLTRRADWWGGPSPFVFPEGVAAADYYGDRAFCERLKTPELDTYSLDGYTFEPIREGQVFHDGGKLYRRTASGDVLEDSAPAWRFSFGKYMERFHVEKPDAVSILMGANDVQNTPYEEAPARIAQFMAELEEIIASIHAFDGGIDVIVCLPISGAEQYAWGLRGNGSARRYRLNTFLLSQAILERWDGRASEHVHICPARLFLDPVAGFDKGAFRDNPCSAETAFHHENWVHPGEAGYRQIGDILASSVEALRA